MLANTNEEAIKAKYPDALILGSTEEGDFGFVAYDKDLDKIIVAFRGSDDKEDWVGENGNLKTKPNTYGIHTGFFGAAHKFKFKVKDYIVNLYVKYGVKDILWCGHSRGGGVSLTLANECAWYKSSEVIVFGTPKVYTKNSQFYQNVKNEVLKVTSVINGEDIVPRSPFTKFWKKDEENYIRPHNVIEIGKQLSSWKKGQMFLYEATGYKDDGYIWFKDHHPNSYERSLEKEGYLD